ncbi:hypothetical protein CVS27_11720 [Arthrobacter glacialis]|uniref:Uncharacterized protein n=1 Tax=Arthrobacter glacialis TaxID=1664 RepID=A0A2S3ZVH3_ARTGL|nr:hypothetical protein CVS27_11720 [Arthrobacter glacialis]
MNSQAGHTERIDRPLDVCREVKQVFRSPRNCLPRLPIGRSVGQPWKVITLRIFTCRIWMSVQEYIAHRLPRLPEFKYSLIERICDDNARRY